ncbi:potassium transporter Kup [Amaricoccus solimangrovi]|uniref:Probable potassium transport system protein Kup n=1 Tax=Amaricoccus solimangrovi TaxID=2589815 RepID=A0A501X167_9RHOB|nr:potassium transporter Kup [Amaricoccus solimangrovi]TPE53196.1 potassium transporter Kup [Amaricoccus solimangrovi]
MTTAQVAQDQAAHPRSHFWKLVLGSIGVVYGDIGTSPLYAMREALGTAARDGLTRAEVIGIVSMLLWTLILIVSFKYVVLILRADNRGEGGTLSLLALAQRAVGRRTPALLVLGILGTALFYGDAVITPAISVLSAIEGVELIEPGFAPYVLPITIAILVALFAVQSQGTELVSRFFGPITLVWFLTMGGLGLLHVSDNLAILHALNPARAVGFVASHGFGALPVMGSVFLAVTGAEALYADMGHFGRGPIRVAWSGLVFPALAVNYLGQGGLVLARPDTLVNPFFLMAPAWGLPALVLLATLATIIASQAVITGAYSITHQAVQLGLLPRLEARHTSEKEVGQIYMPRVNWTLLAGVLILVLSFQNSGALANAYGIAVTGTMVITSLMATVVFRRVWRWPLAAVVAVIAPLLVIESFFLGANLMKVHDGGYVPLVIAAIVCLLIWTWVRGTGIVQRKARTDAVTLLSLIAMLRKPKLARAPGTAVFLTSDPDIAPSALMHNLKHNYVLHERNLIVKVNTATTPTVPESERVVIEHLDENFIRVTLSFGYVEQPNVPRALAMARKQGVKFDIMSTSFFLNRRSFKPSRHSGMPLWQDRLFITLTKAASDATSFYSLPSNRVLELGQQFVI